MPRDGSSWPTIEKAAIERLCVFLHVGLRTADAATEARLRDNPDAVLAPLNQWPDRLIGMMHLNPTDVPGSLDALNRWMRDGPMVGVYFASGRQSLTERRRSNSCLFGADAGGRTAVRVDWYDEGRGSRRQTRIDIPV